MLIINISFSRIEIPILSRKITYKNENNFPYINSIYELFHYNIINNTILIFEPFQYHYECTPGFAKYFIDLGYNVHIILHFSGLDSFCHFEPINKVTFFIYNNIEDIKKNLKILSLILINYNYVLIETANPYYFIIFKELNQINIKHSFFVFHHLDYLNSVPFELKLMNNQIWSLGNFKNAIRVNPHYFGDFKLKKKE